MDFGKFSILKFFSLWIGINFFLLYFFKNDADFLWIFSGFCVGFFTQAILVLIRFYIAKTPVEGKFQKQTILSYLSFLLDFCIVAFFFFLENSSSLLIGFFIAFIAYVTNLVIVVFLGNSRSIIRR